MTRATPSSHPPTPASPALRIGCVSFLNAKPLIESLDPPPLHSNLSIHYDVPSALLADLESDAVDIALCPVIDYQLAQSELVIVPVGGIACSGPTFTVRLFSRIPLEKITTVHVDTHSHTSINLLRVILANRYHIHPTFQPFSPSPSPSPTTSASNASPSDQINWPDAMLIIGDKVVTNSPPAVRYPHQLDLGQAWHEWTGLPFVFAIWMAKRNRNLHDLPTLLDNARRTGTQNIDRIVKRHAAPLGWPDDLAHNYLAHMLNYDITPQHILAIEKYFQLTHALAIYPTRRPLQQYPPTLSPA